MLFRPRNARDALTRHIREAWARLPLLRAHGARKVHAAAIPYAREYGMASKSTTLAQFVVEMLNASRDLLPPTRSPAYVFDKNLLHGVLAPDTATVTAAVAGLDLVGQKARVTLLEFYLGPAGSGAPVHWHRMALNAQAYGRKRWFLYPPDDAVFSAQPSLEWFQGGGPPLEARASLECVQGPGDLLFVPFDWAHGTLNVEASVGMAFEFDFLDHESALATPVCADCGWWLPQVSPAM